MISSVKKALVRKITADLLKKSSKGKSIGDEFVRMFGQAHDGMRSLQVGAKQPHAKYKSSNQLQLSILK